MEVEGLRIYRMRCLPLGTEMSAPSPASKTSATFSPSMNIAGIGSKSGWQSWDYLIHLELWFHARTNLPIIRADYVSRPLLPSQHLIGSFYVVKFTISDRNGFLKIRIEDTKKKTSSVTPFHSLRDLSPFIFI